MQYLISIMERIEKTTFDRIYALKIALTVVNEGTFAAAAKRLGTTPSNITKEIQKLENHLGSALFHRTTRKLSLSEKGKVFINKSKHILDLVCELEDEFKCEDSTFSGALRITAPKTLGKMKIGKILTNFQKLHPELEIDLRLSDRILDPISSGIDISIRTAFQLNDSSLYVKNIGLSQRVICASKKYLEENKRPTTINALTNHNCLNYMRGAGTMPWIFNKKDITETLNVHGSFRSNNMLTLVDACKNGLGIINVPKYLIEDEIKSGELEVLLKSWSIPAHNIFILTTVKPSQSEKIKTLIDYIANDLRN
jgi:DNA-binding transcriptional LysR family regulator